MSHFYIIMDMTYPYIIEVRSKTYPYKEVKIQNINYQKC